MIAYYSTCYNLARDRLSAVGITSPDAIDLLAESLYKADCLTEDYEDSVTRKEADAELESAVNEVASNLEAMTNERDELETALHLAQGKIDRILSLADTGTILELQEYLTQIAKDNENV